MYGPMANALNGCMANTFSGYGMPSHSTIPGIQRRHLLIYFTLTIVPVPLLELVNELDLTRTLTREKPHGARGSTLALFVVVAV